MTLQDNDRWFGIFAPAEPGRYVYAIEAWTDEFATWKRDFELKQKAGQDITLDALEGAALLTRAQYGGKEATAIILRQCEDFLHKGDPASLLVPELTSAMAEGCVRSDLTRSRSYPLTIDRTLAVAGAWYEMVPRSHTAVPDQHGTFRDCIARLPDIAAMGFDVLYFTPIHPIGRTNRKGRNNALTAAADDPGSPYAIGSKEGGHDAIHPDLGTFDDFRELMQPAELMAWRSRSTSPCSVRPIIPGSPSIPTGSSGVRTARCVMRKIHPKNMRILSIQISVARTQGHCGTRFAM